MNKSYRTGNIYSLLCISALHLSFLYAKDCLTISAFYSLVGGNQMSSGF